MGAERQCISACTDTPTCFFLGPSPSFPLPQQIAASNRHCALAQRTKGAERRSGGLPQFLKPFGLDLPKHGSNPASLSPSFDRGEVVKKSRLAFAPFKPHTKRGAASKIETVSGGKGLLACCPNFKPFKSKGCILKKTWSLHDPFKMGQ